MSDYGLKCWDSGGNQTLDTTDLVTRLRHSQYLMATTNGTINLPDLAGVPAGQICLAATPGVGQPHNVQRVATSGVWTYKYQTMPYYSSGNSWVQIFIYT